MALTVEDRMAILNLAARYNHAFDYGDVDTWVQTFKADGIFMGSEGFSRQGVEELTAFAEKYAEGKMIGRHWISSQVIEGDGEWKFSCRQLTKECEKTINR